MNSWRICVEGLVVLCLVLSAVLAAPVSQQKADLQKAEKKDVDQPMVHSPEAELQDLKLHNQEAAVEAPGVENVVENAEEMASEEMEAPQAVPYQTAQQLMDAGGEGAVDLTPQAVAEYLLITGDFRGFDSAINDLYQNGILSRDEVSQYRDDVSWEYENLVSQMMDAEANYLQEVNHPIEAYFRNSRGPTRPESAVESRELPENMMESQDLDFGNELKKLQEEVLSDREATIDQLLQAIVDEYYWRTRENPLNGIDNGPVGDVNVEQQAEDADMEKVIELIQAAMNSEQTDNEIPEAVVQPAKEAETLDETEQELAQLPVKAEKEVDGSGDDEDTVKKTNESKEIMSASA